MLIRAHCFLRQVKFEPLPINFKIDGFSVLIKEGPIKEDNGLMLEISKKINPEEVKIDKEKENKRDLIHIEKPIKKYQAKLQSIASLIEGFLAIHYGFPAPAFDTNHIFVNIQAETKEEENMIKSGEIIGGFGRIRQPEINPNFCLKNNFIEELLSVRSQLPALSFLAQATRQENRRDSEIAFVLYFRIIEGYLGDGTPAIERAFHSKLNELIEYLPYDDKIKTNVKEALKILELPSKSENDYKGMISDLVLLRHKLAHFDSKNSEKYFNSELKFNLDTINNYLRIASMMLILNKSKNQL